MYLSFYKLKHKPFQISTDPRFLWLGEKHEEALATLKYGVLDNKGFLLLTGDVGTGKTTLINALLNSLDKNTFVASIRDPALNPLEFFQYTAHAFGMKASNINSKIAFLIQFEEFLLEAYNNRRKVLLIIDEAQRISQELLEEVRLLSNIEREESKLINIFFVGQLEFNEILLKQENRPIRQRITINYNIETLTEKETYHYIQHRLDVASLEKVVSSFTPVQKMENGEYVRQGYTLPLSDTRKEIFTPKAIREIHNFAKGYPRLINIICDRALLTGYVGGAKTITDSHVKECVKELEIPHNKKEKSAARASESAAVANINAIRTDQEISNSAHNDALSEEQFSRAPQQKSPVAAGPAHDNKSARELLSDLEKLVLKNEKQPQPADQATSPNHNESDKKKHRSKHYRHLLYFIIALAFGVFFYITFTPSTLFNSNSQHLQADSQTLVSATEEEAKTESIMEEPPSPQQSQAAEQTELARQNGGNGDSMNNAAITLSSSPPQNTMKDDVEKTTQTPVNPPNDATVPSSISENDTSPANVVSQEKEAITTKIQQLKELITFQKLTIPFSPQSTLPPDDSLKELDKLIDALRAHHSFKVTLIYYVNGSTNSVASAQQIERQAGAIKSYLMGRGLQAERINILEREKQSISPFQNDTTSESSNNFVEVYVDR